MSNETRDRLANEWIFKINGSRWSNNNDEAGDNFDSFKAGWDAALDHMRHKSKWLDDPTVQEVLKGLEQCTPDELAKALRLVMNERKAVQ